VHDIDLFFLRRQGRAYWRKFHEGNQEKEQTPEEEKRGKKGRKEGAR